MSSPCTVKPGFNYTVYPCALDSSEQLPITVDLVTPVSGEVVNRHRESILAIESELGVAPSGTFTTVRARLDSLEVLLDHFAENGGAIVINDNGSLVVPIASLLNFIGVGVSVTNGGSGIANITISGTGTGGSFDGYSVQETISAIDSQTVFELTQDPLEDSVNLYLNGIKQQYNFDYTVSGSTVTYAGSVSILSTDTVEFTYLTAGDGGEDSGTINHGGLVGLEDDDHPQYLLADGTRDVSGDLNMGTFNITNVGTVDGVDISTHASRHQNGGQDEISVTGLSGLLADAQAPLAHVSSHQNGGSDEISVTGLSGLLADAQTPLGHAASHLRNGSDEIDGYNLEVNFNPNNYTDPLNNLLGQHLFRIDQALGATIVDHGALTGLSDDDHTQYLLIAGTRAMTGALNMGAQAITNVGSVDGVDVSDHNARHEFGGSDAIDGYQLEVVFNPSNYTDATNNLLGQHLFRIDQALGSITVDHGALTGLSDDDHTQYLLVNGTRAMTGALNMGAFNITNVGTVDGVDISDHNARHEFGGADIIDGYQLVVAYNPSNYTDATNNLLGQHLFRIDEALANVGLEVRESSSTVVGNSTVLNFFGPGVDVTNAGFGIADIYISGTGGSSDGYDGYIVHDSVTPTNGQTEFTLSDTPANIESVLMFLNGLKQQYNVDYTVIDNIVTYSGDVVIVSEDVIEFYYVIGGLTSGTGIIVSQDDDVIVSPATQLNFTGSGVSVTDGGNGIANIEITGGGGSGVDGYAVQESFTPINDQTVFTLSETTINENNILMFLNGLKQQYGVDYTVINNIVTYSGDVALVDTDTVEFSYLSDGYTGTSNIEISQDDISIVSAINGINFTGAGVVVTNAGDGIANVEISGAGPDGYATQESFIPTDGQTVFTLTNIVINEENVLMFINGLKQQYDVDYAVLGNVVTYLGLIPISSTDIVEFSYLMGGTSEDAGSITVINNENIINNINEFNFSSSFNVIDNGNGSIDIDIIGSGVASDGYVEVSEADVTVVAISSKLNFDGPGVSVTDGGNGVANIFIDTSEGSGGDGYAVQESFTPTSEQVLFTLSQSPINAENVFMYVNGLKQQYGVDYTVAGTNVTYLGLVPISSTDVVEISYIVGGISGVGFVGISEDSALIVGSASVINFTGSGVSVTDGGGGIANIEISGSSATPSDSTPEAVAASGYPGVASEYSRSDHAHTSPNLATVLATGNLSGDNDIEMRNGRSVLLRPVGDAASLFVSSGGSTPANARIEYGGTYSAQSTSYQPVDPVTLEQDDILSYEYGGIANSAAGFLTFTVVGNDGSDAFFIRYQVLLCAGPFPPGGMYNDVLKPIVVGADWASDPGFTVTLSGTSPNRAINFEHTGAATVDVNLFVAAESFSFTVPTPP